MSSSPPHGSFFQFLGYRILQALGGRTEGSFLADEPELRNTRIKYRLQSMQSVIQRHGKGMEIFEEDSTFQTICLKEPYSNLKDVLFVMQGQVVSAYLNSWCFQTQQHGLRIRSPALQGHETPNTTCVSREDEASPLFHLWGNRSKPADNAGAQEISNLKVQLLILTG